MVSKKEITDSLKQYGLQFIKLSTGDSWSNGKLYKNNQDKAIKGFEGGSQGPYTSTDAHLQHNKDKKAEVVGCLEQLGAEISEVEGITTASIQTSCTSKRVIKLFWSLIPTYTRSANYDPMYRTWWLLPTITDIPTKKSEDQIAELVEEKFEEIEEDVVLKLGIAGKDYDVEFNKKLRECFPELKADKRNFYKIYCKYGPQ